MGVQKFIARAWPNGFDYTMHPLHLGSRLLPTRRPLDGRNVGLRHVLPHAEKLRKKKQKVAQEKAKSWILSQNKQRRETTTVREVGSQGDTNTGQGKTCAETRKTTTIDHGGTK